MSLRWSGLVLVGVVSVMGLTTCGGPSHTVARIDPNTQTDLSGKWNDTDAKETSAALIKECLDAPWLAKFTKEKGKEPTIRVRDVERRTDEHIDTQVFIKNIEKAIVNDGRAEIYSQDNDRELGAVTREQNLSASGRVSDDTAVSSTNLTGVNYVIVGIVATIRDKWEGKQAIFYKVTFELHDSTTGKKVWMGDHEIKKLIQQKGSQAW
jgi:penicillin-binding protein activator